MIEHIRKQANSMAKKGWKLSAVTVATLYDGRGMLKLWWQAVSAFGGARGMDAATASPAPRFESSQPLDQSEPAEVEHAVLAAAAQCGAKTVSRIERSPLALRADPYAPGTGLVAALANTSTLEVPWLCHENFPEKIQVLIERAADEGWIMWLFEPAAGIALAGFRDASALTTGIRVPRHLHLAPFADRDHHHIYYLARRTPPRRSRAAAGARPYPESSRAHAMNERAPLR